MLFQYITQCIIFLAASKHSSNPTGIEYLMKEAIVNILKQVPVSEIPTQQNDSHQSPPNQDAGGTFVQDLKQELDFQSIRRQFYAKFLRYKEDYFPLPNSSCNPLSPDTLNMIHLLPDFFPVFSPS